MSLDPISALLNVGELAIKRIWPDPEKQAEEQRKLAEIAQTGELAQLNAHVTSLTGQLEINKMEAQHKSIFVAGWRPFCGWVGGFGLAYAAVIEPVMRFAASMFGYSGSFPVLDTAITMQVLFGMLGLGAYRTYEKQKGVQSDSLTGRSSKSR